MNNVKLTATVVTNHSFTSYKAGKKPAIKFKVQTEEPAVNHNNGSRYVRKDTHWVIVWDAKLANGVLRNVQNGDQILLEGKLRTKVLHKGRTPQTVVSVEAESVKKLDRGYFRHVSTGRF